MCALSAPALHLQTAPSKKSPCAHAGERLAAHHQGGGAWIPSRLAEAGAIKLKESLPTPHSGRYWKVTAAGQAYMEEHKRRWDWFGKSGQPWKDFMRLWVSHLPPPDMCSPSACCLNNAYKCSRLRCAVNPGQLEVHCI